MYKDNKSWMIRKEDQVTGYNTVIERMMTGQKNRKYKRRIKIKV